MSSSIYLVYNIINGKIYVGKTIESEKRWSRHLRISRGGKEKYPNSFSLLHKAIRKHNEKNFIFKIVQIFIKESEALDAEKLWISELKTMGYELYNLTEGGEGSSGYKHPPETIEKISGSNNAFYGRKHSQHTKQYLSELFTGKRNPRYGATASSETLIKQSANRVGKCRGTDNPKSKFSEEQIRIIRTDYLINKISIITLSKKYSVTRRAIWLIVTNRSYKNVI